MKLSLPFVACLSILGLAAWVASAPEQAAKKASTSEGKVTGTTVDIPLPNQGEGTQSKGPTSADVPVLERELKEAFDSFFARLTEGKVEAAYKALLEKSRIGKEPAILEEFVTKTTEMQKLHGKIESVELIHVHPIGKNLREVVYQVSSVNHPSRWRIFAYQGGGRWQVLDIDVSSDLTKMVE